VFRERSSGTLRRPGSWLALSILYTWAVRNSTDTEHVLLSLHCPLTHNQRQRHLIGDGQLDSLKKLFDSPRRSLGQLRSLEETPRVCAKPRIAWEPGYLSHYRFRLGQGSGIREWGLVVSTLQYCTSHMPTTHARHLSLVFGYNICSCMIFWCESGLVWR
jgi:hypothetical protein